MDDAPQGENGPRTTMAGGPPEVGLTPIPGSSDDRLLTVLSAADLSLGSPDVRTSAERDRSAAADRSADIFRAFGFDGGDAVLLIGAVDGAVARFLAETVRSVVVIAAEAGAELVSARCRSLSNVSIAPSAVDAATRRLPFNAILSPSGPIDPDDLAALAPVIDARTMVVWAEHNPFGLDRLFGESTAAELLATHAKNDQDAAHDALAEAGLRLRSTLYPYPTVAAPRMVLAPPLFRHEQKAALFDLVAAHDAPLAASNAAAAGQPDPASDPDRLRALLHAGAARSLMPARLVVASRSALPSSRFDHAVAAWSFERSADSIWCSMHRFVPVADSDADDVSSVHQFSNRLFPAHGRAERGWVSLALIDDVAVPLRQPLQAELCRAIARGDVEHIGTLLKQWRSAVQTHEQPSPDDAVPAMSPFAPTASESRLAPEWFDVRMTNVALDADGLRLLGQRFRLSGPVATDLVLARSYWLLARSVVGARLPHPWSTAITVDELAQTLASSAGDDVGPAAFDRWRTAEAELLAITSGGDAASHLQRLSIEGGSDAATLAATASGADLRVEVVRLRSELDASVAAAASSDARVLELQSQLEAATDAEAGTIEDLQAELTALTRERDRQNDKIDAQSRLLTEVIRKYERAVHERNMVEQGMQSYRRVVTIAKRVMPTDVYFRVRKIVRGH